MLKGRPKEALFGCLEAHASITFLTSLKDSVLQEKAIQMLESKAPLEPGTEQEELLAAHWDLYQALPWHEVAQLDEKERGERQVISNSEQWFLIGEKLIEALAAEASASRPSAVVLSDKEAGRAAAARAEHTTLHARNNLFGCCMQAFQSQEALEKHECKAYQTFRKKGELALVAVKMFMICSSCGDYTAYTKQDNFKTFMMNHPMKDLVSVAVRFESREFAGKAVNIRHVPTTAENWAAKWKGNTQLAEIMGKLGPENPADFVIFTDLVEQSKDHNPIKEPCAIVSDPPISFPKSPIAQDIINRFAVNLELHFDRQSIKQADIDHRKVFFCLKITCQAFVLDERKMTEHLKGCDPEADIGDPSKAFPVRPRSRDFHARHYCHKCKFSGCSLDSL